MTEPVILSLPFAGRWRAVNSPARRVPSHGSNILGTRYAIDFVAVDDRGRTAREWSLATLVGTEPAERFLAFGLPILSPVAGTVVAAHDGEVDHEARRSPLSLVGYLLGQAGRLRAGLPAIAGNHVLIALPDGAVVGLMHLRAGSLLVAVGNSVTVGTPLGECGNSGNSTQPHVHVQVMDNADATVANGLPLAFSGYREWVRGTAIERPTGAPAEGAVVESMPVA